MWRWMSPLIVGWFSAACLVADDRPWQRFVIDDSLRGADGVRLADANGDGRPDIATGWEESGTTRIYLHPGVAEVRSAWPSCTVGSAPSVEDAVWIDFDRDGKLDVLSSCEGNEQSLRVHFSPKSADSALTPSQWTTQVIASAHRQTRWMFALPVPNPSEPDYVIVGSKAPRGMVGLLTLGRSVLQARLTRLCDAQWIMSLVSLDVDRDGDLDIVFSDRKGDSSGVYWLENTGQIDQPWTKHLIGGLGREVMFLKLVPNLASDPASVAKRHEIVVATKPNSILWLRQDSDDRRQWQVVEEILVEPADRVGRAKAVAVADLTGDGRLDLVYSCEGAEGPRSGVVLLTREAEGNWKIRDVSGPDGIKFDRLELVDLDFDGDLDVLTCEERHGGRGLGVVWYVNPVAVAD